MTNGIKLSSPAMKKSPAKKSILMTNGNSNSNNNNGSNNNNCNLLLSRHNNSSRYERIRVIGKGSFGVATLYRRKEDDSLVILKEINLHDMSAPERNLTLNEVELLSKLDHPHIVGYYDSFEEDGTLMIEMEYADGGTLAQLLERRSKPLNEPDLLDLFEQAISAVSYLHDNSVIHRDLKTANIFLTKENMVKIGDFGVSKQMGAETQKLGAKTILGTPYYLSPEICQGNSYNEKSDVWSMGCCLYEMATLQKAFDASNFAALITRIINADYEPLKGGTYSDGLKVLVRDILTPDPDMRPCAKEILFRVRALQKNLSSPGKVSRLFQSFGNTSLSLSASMDASIGSASDEQTGITKKCQSALYSFDLKSVTVQQISGLPKRTKILQLAASEKFCMLLTDRNEVLAWGDNRFGQLGMGDRKDRKTATKVDALSGKDISKIALGKTFSVFCAERGIVMTCGNRKFIGNGASSDDFLKPKIIDSLLSESAVDISCGDEHTAVLCESGALYVWGNGESGRLGTGSESPVFVPYKVEIPSYQLVCKVICGPDSTVLLTRSGTMLATGSNEHNKLNLNAREGFFTNSASCSITKKAMVHTPVKPFSSRVVRVSLGKNHSGVILENGMVHLFGGNSSGELGLGHCQPAGFCAPFRSVKALAYKVCVHLTCGDGFTMVGTSENEIYFWGSRGALVPLIKTSDEEWSIVNGQWTKVTAGDETKRGPMPFSDVNPKIFLRRSANKKLDSQSSPSLIQKNQPKSISDSDANHQIPPNGTSIDDEIIVLQPKLLLKLDVMSQQPSTSSSYSNQNQSPPGTASTFRTGTPTSPPPKTASWTPTHESSPSISLAALVATGHAVIAVVNYSQGEHQHQQLQQKNSSDKGGGSAAEKKPPLQQQRHFFPDEDSPKIRSKKAGLSRKKSSPARKSSNKRGTANDEQTDEIKETSSSSRRLSAPECIAEVATWIRQEMESAEFIPFMDKTKSDKMQSQTNVFIKEAEQRLKAEIEDLRRGIREQYHSCQGSEKRIAVLQKKLVELRKLDDKTSDRFSLRRSISNLMAQHGEPPPEYSPSPPTVRIDDLRKAPEMISLGIAKKSGKVGGGSSHHSSPESTTTTLPDSEEGNNSSSKIHTKICTIM